LYLQTNTFGTTHILSEFYTSQTVSMHHLMMVWKVMGD